MQSLAKGLAVLECFDDAHAALTLSDVARRTAMTRAAARRLLLTLTQLGYCANDGKRFRLTPRVLNLGFAYLHAGGIWTIAQPYMVELVEQIHESCSAAVLDGRDIVYVARVPVQTRIMSIGLTIGSRLPAHWTSMGRVLLAELPDQRLRGYLAELGPLAAKTERSITDAKKLREVIRNAGEQGYAMIDQELEPGLRSIAVPVRGADGRVGAALNVGTHAARVTTQQLLGNVLPRLKHTAERISLAIGARPSGRGLDVIAQPPQQH